MRPPGKPAALALLGVVLVAGLSVALAVPHGGIPSLLDLTSERLPAPPELRLTSPTPGEGVGDLVRLTGLATSAERDVIDVQMRIDGGRWQSIDAAVRGSPAVPFAEEVAIGPGTHLVEARAWDGEAYSLPARVEVRRDAPTLVLAQPSDGDAVAGSVVVAGTVVGEATRVVVHAGGNSVEAPILPGGAWTTTVALGPGVHEVVAIAHGPVPSLAQRARVSVGGPALHVAAPDPASSYGEAGDLACGGGCILFTGGSERAARIGVQLDGRDVGAATLAPGGPWTWRLPMLGLANGTHRVVLTAIDASGARSVPREVMFLARTPVVLRIDGTSDPAPTGTPLSFVATGEHAQSSVWSLDGEEIGVGSALGVVLDRPGDHQLVARTQPPTGSASTATISLYAQNRPPSVSLLDQAIAVGATAQLTSVATDPDGNIVEYRWEFGDGTSATTTEPQISHRFHARGVHRVNLTVVDDFGGAAGDSRLVFVPNAAPLARATWGPKEPTIHDAVTFSDASRDPDGVLTRRLWTLPDGSTTEAENVTVRFSSPGEHRVSLAVMDDAGEIASLTQGVRVLNLPPLAAFAHHPAVPVADEDVLFSDLSTDPEQRIVSWRWDLGDGTIRTTSSVLHRYADPGNYTVTLHVADLHGGNASFSLNLTVRDTPPVLRAIVAEPPEPRSLQNVTFRAVGADREGGLASYRWEFGDGTTATGPEPAHAYPRSGTYHGRLTVLDDAGLNATLPFTLRVANTGPSATLQIVDGGYAAFPSLLEAHAADPDGKVALYRFDADGDGDADCIVTVPRCAFTYPTPGAFGARLWAEDDEGAIVEAQRVVEMLAPPSHLVPPTVRIDAPAENATLRGIQHLRGDASGVRPIAKVELQLQQGAWAYSGSPDPWRLAVGGAPWTSLLDTRPFPNGDYELVVRATDTAGGVGFARIPIRLENGARPNEVTVQLAELPEVLADDALVRGSAYHPQGVTSVRWRIDEGSWRFLSSSPLAFTIPVDLDALGPGNHTLQVEAFHGTTERAATNVTFRIPGDPPKLVVDEPPPPIAHGLLRATGRVIGIGHAQWKLDHGLWRDLPPGEWVLAEETMKIPGGPHEVHLRAISPEGFPSEVRTYAFRVVNPSATDPVLRSHDAPETRATSAGALAIVLGAFSIAIVVRRR